MVFFPNSKINLGLRVLGKRADGYHDLDTIFYPLPLKDAAEILPAHSVIKNSNGFELTVTGIPVGSSSNNLCYQAFQLLKKDFPDIPSCKMNLHKAIPPGAGLGGGSSDAAFTLVALNKLFDLKIDTEKLQQYALQLGSDCPFFILNRACHATGRGERMKEISLALEGYVVVLVHPHIHITTAAAFAQIAATREGTRQENLSYTCAEAITQPMEKWKDTLTNDFEGPVFSQHPLLAEIKEKLYSAGAVYASMTGTGSCIYGIFRRGEEKAYVESGSHTVYKLNLGQ